MANTLALFVPLLGYPSRTILLYVTCVNGRGQILDHVIRCNCIQPRPVLAAACRRSREREGTWQVLTLAPSCVSRLIP